MSSVINDNGFILESFEDKITRFRGQMRAAFGDEIDLSDESLAGIITSIDAERFQNAELLAQALQSQFDKDQAQGIFLDFLLSLTLNKRLEAAPTRVVASCRGANGTQLTIGSNDVLAAMSSGQNQFALEQNIVIDFSNAVEAFLKIEQVQDSTAYTIKVDIVEYTFNSGVSATEQSILIGLRNAVNAGTQNVTAALSGTRLWIYSDDFTTPYSFEAVTTNVKVDEAGTNGNFAAIENGAIICPTGGLDSIVTAKSGWLSIYNYLPGTTGRLAETDDEARERTGDGQVSECATDGGIRKAVFKNVAGVSNVRVKSNREETTDSDGIPPHRFLVLVQGGNDQEIVNAIFNAQPSGIKSYGNTSGTAIDSEGISQTIYYSRPEPIYVWLNIELDVDADFPSGGAEVIREAINTRAAEIFTIGVTGKLQQLYDECFAVEGVVSINTFEAAYQSAVTPDPDPGDYSDSNIPVTFEQVLIFAVDRINLTTV